MGSIFLENFKFGMDQRRQRVAGTNGTLWNAKNVVISRGGDIERAKAFVPTYNLPAGQTFGLGTVRGQLYTFGSVPNPGVPLSIQYQQLVAPSGAAMVQVLDVRAADAALYVIARYADGNIYHFYNGARVTDWDALADANTDFPTTASYLADLISSDPAVSAISSGATIVISALVPGVPFTISKSTIDFGGTSDQDVTLTTVQANVPVVAEVRATTLVSIVSGSAGAGNTINNITINGVALMLAPVPWQTDNPTTLAAIATQINNLAEVHGYNAVASGTTMTITAAVGTGATPNEYAVLGVVSGTVVLETPSMSGGVTAMAGVAQIVTATLIGTFQSVDQFNITINANTYATTGRAAGTGTSGYVIQRRLFSPANSLWEYCAINTFNDFHTATESSGAGFLNVSNDSEGSERLIGAGTFITQAAVFSRRNISVYNMNTDATQIILSQPLNNSGALSARSILGYGTEDLFYLDTPGIRSLKARYATDEPFVNDIGVPIDTFIRAQLNTLSLGAIEKACAVVEPLDGRFWLALDNRVYVLSYFPGSQISAWTYFEPGFSITDFARVYQQLYARAGDTVYLYGGQSGTQYPAAGQMIAEVDLPFAASQPPGVEMMLGFDMAASGEWLVKALVDPNNEALYLTVGTIDGITYAETDITFPGRTTHVAFNLTCSGAGFASVSNIALHTDGKEENV